MRNKVYRINEERGELRFTDSMKREELTFTGSLYKERRTKVYRINEERGEL